MKIVTLDDVNFIFTDLQKQQEFIEVCRGCGLSLSYTNENWNVDVNPSAETVIKELKAAKIAELEARIQELR